MGRLRRCAITGCAVLALAGSARAAEVTRVETAAEPGNALDVEFSIGWDRFQERGLISREATDATTGGVEYLPQLRYTRVSNALVPRIAVGLYKDLELHARLPYVLADDTTWHYAVVGGLPVNTPGDLNTIAGTNPYYNIDASGAPCAVTPCPLFPVGGGTTVYHGGKAGDLVAGLAWAIMNERKDDTKPTWVVGFDLTFPTAQLYDPATGRTATFTDTSWRSPYANAAKPGPFGEKLWKFELATAVSRRIGAIDPYFKAHLRLARKSANTFSNCDAAPALAAESPSQMASWAPPNCTIWGDDASAQPPYVAGVMFGTEIVPYENAKDGQKVSIDVRLGADYTSSARWYNELSDALGKLLWTEDYLTMKASLAVDVTASEYVALRAATSFGTSTAHWLTGEYLGRTRTPIPGPPYDATNADLNPNYDFRVDTPGRRFRISEVTLFEVTVTGILRF
jgi:hypothetical protein